MEKKINREDIDIDWINEMLETESHHDHEILETSNGILRWKENPVINFLVDNYDLNDIVCKLFNKGYTKNSELYRKLYRDMGYSLYGYWEVFYWDANNVDAENYKPNEL